ncbi:MAG: GntR family transcriptional regulator [Bacillota bacterium]
MAGRFVLRRSPRLEDCVTMAVREAILTGRVKPGERLSQADLSSELGVSRMPVRHALRQLQTEGLVEMDERGTAVVRPLSGEDIVESYYLRALLESKAVALSVPSLSDEDLEDLAEYHHSMEEAAQDKDTTTFLTANREFHACLRSRCPWRRLLRLVDILWDGMPPVAVAVVPNWTLHSQKCHQDILQAARAGDGKRTGRLMYRHIRSSGEAVGRLLGEAGVLDFPALMQVATSRLRSD